MSLPIKPVPRLDTKPDQDNAIRELYRIIAEQQRRINELAAQVAALTP